MRRVIFGVVIIALFASLLLAEADPAPTKGPYQFGPDSKIQPGVPQGKWEKYFFDKSEIYPGTTREIWIYIPAQYDGKEPACLMVFQDGPRQYAVRENEVDRPSRKTAEYRAASVFDNLIHKKELPLIIGVFINPGSRTIAANGQPDFANRSVEYDTVSDTYSQFLLKEILPPIEAKYNIRKDPAGRAIGGISSGAICAFTVAWNHPDVFGKVHSDVGSFTNIRGGHVYPQLVKDSPKKPLKIAMEDGTNDNTGPDRSGQPRPPERDWYHQNKLMHENLLAKGYEVRYVLGDNVHGSAHAGPIFPDQMRWLWKDQVKSTTQESH